ncbi:MAG: hypothetical protein J6L00_02355 [Clostridia bacterium]|nr:hypothetical protein [Clostridia bacterium]
MEEQYKPLFEEAIPTPPPEKKQGRAGVLLVQSICCAVLVLLFWLFRVLGGDSFTALKTAFYSALENNVLMETVVGVFADRTPDETQETTDGSTTPTTTATTANG